MAHYALVKDQIVLQVITVSNEVVGDYPESEVVGQAFLASIGLEGHWVETSYNANFRGCYAGVGYKYDGINFIPVFDENVK